MPSTARSRMWIFITIAVGMLCLVSSSQTRRVTAVHESVSASLDRSQKNPRFTSYSRSALFQGPSPDAPVEQTRKNIQVLKGLPESQLTRLMNSVATSLGVQCNFCHVQQGKDPKTGFTNWIWESDDKPEKQTARRMIRMVLSINGANKADFRENAVTCFTCHRGQREPTGLQTLPVARSGHEPDPVESVTGERTPAPSVEQILSRYLEASGGSAVAATKNLVMKGKREASQDRNFPTEITFAMPDRILVVANTPQAVIRQSVTGERGWVANGANIRAMTPAGAADALRSWTDSFNIIKVTQSPGMRSVGVRRAGARDANVIELRSDTKNRELLLRHSIRIAGEENDREADRVDTHPRTV
jgi:Photosynthetic reaction centre cytochrome C subunit